MSRKGIPPGDPFPEKGSLRDGRGGGVLLPMNHALWGHPWVYLGHLTNGEVRSGEEFNKTPTFFRILGDTPDETM